MTKINLGDEVIDTISGFKGVAIGKTDWLAGCTRITVQPKVGKDGKLNESQTFDEPLLKITKRKNIENENKKVGGFNIKVEKQKIEKR